MEAKIFNKAVNFIKYVSLNLKIISLQHLISRVSLFISLSLFNKYDGILFLNQCRPIEIFQCFPFGLNPALWSFFKKKMKAPHIFQDTINLSDGFSYYEEDKKSPCARPVKRVSNKE